jgi:hypothetical protein
VLQDHILDLKRVDTLLQLNQILRKGIRQPMIGTSKLTGGIGHPVIPKMTNYRETYDAFRWEMPATFNLGRDSDQFPPATDPLMLGS